MKYVTASLALITAALAANGCTLEVDTSNTGYATGMVAAPGGERATTGALGGSAGLAAGTNADSRAVASRVVTVVAVLLRGQTPRGEVRFQVARGALTLLTARTLAAGQITGGTLVVSDERDLGGGRSRWTLGGGSVVLAGVAGECAVRAGGEVTLTRDVDGVWAVADGRAALDDAASLTAGADVAVGGAAATGAATDSGALVVAPEADFASGRGTASGGAVTTVTPVSARGGGVVVAGGAAGGAAATGVAAGGAGAGGARVTVSVSVPAAVRRIAAGGSVGVILGGRVALAGLPDAASLEVIDGDVQFAPATATTGVAVTGGASAGAGAGATTGAVGGGGACFRATGGTLLVAARGGRRFRVRVTAGQVVLRGAGRGTSGQAFWSATGGELTVRVAAEGDATLALAEPGAGAGASFGTAVVGAAQQGGGASVTASAPAAPAVPVLSARALAALDTLVSLAPAGSRAAVRQQTAVDLVVQSARSADAVVYDTPIVGHSVVLVVDLSYSMSELVPEFRGRSFDPRVAPTKLDIARAELVKVLASLPAGTTVSVVGFSSDLHTLWAQPRTVDDAALEAAIRWVASLRPLDETEPVAALRAAEAMRADQVVLISDGRPTQLSEAESALLSLADGIGRRGARLDAVGVGSDQDESFLATLTARGHGCARHW